jgi:hypothetical protein
LALRIHVNQTPTEGDTRHLVENAVRNYFSYRAKLSRLELKRLLKQGRISLVIGILFLGGCLVASDLLAQREHGTLFSLARESLTIAGWVAIWHPMQTFLYDWWPLLNMRRLYEKLSGLPVEVVKRGG